MGVFLQCEIEDDGRGDDDAQRERRDVRVHEEQRAQQHDGADALGADRADHPETEEALAQQVDRRRVGAECLPQPVSDTVSAAVSSTGRS